MEEPCVRDVRKYEKCGHWDGKYTKCKGTNVLIDYSGLDTRFAHYYQQEYRVELAYKDGTKERGYVGKSTGWKPIWLLIKKSNSMGGEALCQELVVDIKPLYRRK